MRRFNSPSELQNHIHALRTQGIRIGFVPTMGALHQGHLSLIERAKETTDQIITSIFVNPLQFGPGEDLDRYPRPLEEDCAKLQSAGAHAVFLPTQNSMYPNGEQTRVLVDQITQELCGASRPGHFTGVTTVVMKLLNIAQAHEAFFGEKDYQQLCVIKRMARDLFIPTKIVGCPTVREADGLALSSRNRYLSATDRVRALAISKTLHAARALVSQGTTNVHELIDLLRPELAKNIDSIDYLEIRDAVSLDPIDAVNAPAVLLIAAFVSGTRLIDNIVLEV